jgi:hypothetical protein
MADASGVLLNRSVVGQKTFDFNVDGLAHMGMLPDLIEDFKALGLTDADLSPLLNSAEGYIQVWKKAGGIKAGGIKAPLPKSSGKTTKRKAKTRR